MSVARELLARWRCRNVPLGSAELQPRNTKTPLPIPDASSNVMHWKKERFVTPSDCRAGAIAQFWAVNDANQSDILGFFNVAEPTLARNCRRCSNAQCQWCCVFLEPLQFTLHTSSIICVEPTQLFGVKQINSQSSRMTITSCASGHSHSETEWI